MGVPILPEVLREDIKELFRKGYTRGAVSNFIRDEAQKYMSTEKELARCIASIEWRVTDKPKKRIGYPEKPDLKEFDGSTFRSVIDGLRRNTAKEKLVELGTEITM